MTYSYTRYLLAGLLLFAAAEPLTAKPDSQPVSLRFRDTPIATVLSSLAEQLGFDVVVGPGIESTVSVDLTDVDWEIAVEALATANGLMFHWSDDVLIVLGDQEGGGKVHEVVTLRYADPGAVQSVLANVLSPNGHVTVYGAPAEQSSSASSSAGPPFLIITETPYHMPAVLALIDSLDVARPQFEISVKFVETSLDDQMRVGLSWPTKLSATVADRSQLNTTNGVNTSTQSTPAAEYPIPDGKIWNFGTLSVDQFGGFMEFLKQNGKSQLLSDPRVTVLENQTATMKVTTTFPVETVSRFSEGASTQDIVDFYDIEVGISLSVTPRFNDDGLVTLQVEPSVEEITGFTGPPNNRRPITANRRVKTIVRVKDNETLVIGGLVRETEISTKSKVWLLGDIPILGALFTHHKTEKQKTDLLIFITPRILADAVR